MSVQNICSTKAYDMLVSNDNAFLVDVRTREEWKQIGIPCLKNKNEVVFLSWQLSPFMEINKDFEDSFLSIVNDKIDAIIFFLCRSGYRSSIAANCIANIGYRNCYNISDGFEGNNRVLPKLTYREEFKGDTKRSTAAYIDVYEDASIGSTYKLPIEVEFRENSQNKGWKQNNLPWQF